MQDDLKERLRAQRPEGEPISVARLMDEAADRIAALEAKLAEKDALVGLVRKVLQYRRGEGPFNFSGLSQQQRANASCDAWDEIEAELAATLAKIKDATNG